LENCNICRTSLVEEANYCHTCGAIVKNTTTQEFFVPGGKVTKKVTELLQEGKVSRINVKNDIGKALLEIQVRACVMSVLSARWLPQAGVVAALATRCIVSLVRMSRASEPSWAKVKAQR
jgi:hypothetical protein